MLDETPDNEGAQELRLLQDSVRKLLEQTGGVARALCGAVPMDGTARSCVNFPKRVCWGSWLPDRRAGWTWALWLPGLSPPRLVAHSRQNRWCPWWRWPLPTSSNVARCCARMSRC